MTRKELTKIFSSHSVYNGVGDYYMVRDRFEFMDKIIKLHEEKVKQLAIYLNK